MKRTLGTLTLAGALSFGALAAISLTTTPAEAQYRPIPVEVVATLTPVYHEGHATYWYGGYWHYRNRGAWTYYRVEPAFLRDHRLHHPATYHHYYRR